MKRSLDHDFSFWKCDRFIKEPELKAVKDLILEHFFLFKNSFLYLASQSSFPHVHRNEFIEYAKEHKMVDKHLTLSHLDRLFIACNVELDHQVDNPNAGLARFEFIELLVRSATFKYKDTGIVETFAEALEMLIS